MPLEDVVLLASALTDVESARDYLQLSDDSLDRRVIEWINAATGWIERRTRRALKSRSYSGASALKVNGYGTKEAVCPEYPVTTVSSVSVRESDGTLTALDITGHRIEPGGVIFLPNDVIPEGEANVELTVIAGYLAATHDAELAVLEHACERLVLVYYQDWKDKIGRGTGYSVAGFSVSLIRDPVPADVSDLVDRFGRVP